MTDEQPIQLPAEPSLPDVPPLVPPSRLGSSWWTWGPTTQQMVGGFY